jgi:hypothetical protein
MSALRIPTHDPIDAFLKRPALSVSKGRLYKFFLGWLLAFRLLSFLAHWPLNVGDWLVVGFVSFVLAVECSWAHSHEPLPGTVDWGNPPHWSTLRAECQCGATIRRSPRHAGSWIAIDSHKEAKS